MRLGAVLLAAGRSLRFGREDKLLADAGGRTMLSRALETLNALDADERAAVVSSEEASKLAEEVGFDVVRNDEPEAGLSRSIALGVLWAHAKGCDAVLLAVADQPLLTAESLAALLAAFRRTGRVACLADESHRGNPAVFPAACFAELLALRGDCGAKGVLRKHEDELTVVRCRYPCELADADEPQALERLRGRLAQREAKMGFGDEIPKQVWNRSLPPPVAETGRRGLETARNALRDYASFPGRQSNVSH